MTLVEASAGGFVPPFPLSGPDRTLGRPTMLEHYTRLGLQEFQAYQATMLASMPSKEADVSEHDAEPVAPLHL